MTDSIAIIIVVAMWGALNIISVGLQRQDTAEVLRLLKRGDKVDCRMSDMRGTTP